MASTKKPRRRSTLGTIIEHRNHFKARYTWGGQWHMSCVRDRVAFRGLNQTTLWGSG